MCRAGQHVAKRGLDLPSPRFSGVFLPLTVPFGLRFGGAHVLAGMLLLPGFPPAALPAGHFILTGSQRISQPLGLRSLFSFFLKIFFCFLKILFYSRVGLGFPLSGTGALSAFPSALLPGPGEQRLLCLTLLTLCFLAQKGTRITELLGHY